MTEEGSCQLRVENGSTVGVWGSTLGTKVKKGEVRVPTRCRLPLKGLDSKSSSVSGRILGCY